VRIGTTGRSTGRIRQLLRTRVPDVALFIVRASEPQAARDEVDTVLDALVDGLRARLDVG
jgi:hypothetical protein